MRDKTVLLLGAQLVLITGLMAMEVVIEVPNRPQGFIRGVLWIALAAVSVVLLLMRLRFRTDLADMTAALRRAAGGNANTRLLAKAEAEPFVNEAVFAVNELIEQLDKIRVQTFRAEAARRSLLSNISHDIRTPLTSIIGYVDALDDDIAATPQERREYVGIVARKAKALKLLIDDIFQMAKLDADEVPLHPETLDLAELAREAVIAFWPEMKQAGMELAVAIPEDPCMAVADRISLQRILNNLLGNALQYGHEGRVLGIELTERGEAYQLTVWDKGPGITPDDLPRVFDRLYRSERSRNPMYGGSGLGLAIAKALAEKNGGTLWAESEPGRRTAFAFTVPKSG